MVRILTTTLLLLVTLVACQDNSSETHSSSPATAEQSAEQLAEERSFEAQLHDTARYIASQAFQAMSGVLMRKIQEEGALAAFDYCRVQALPLTDSVSAAQGVRIQRLATRYRNPANAANADEQAIIADWEAAVARGDKPLPQFKEVDDRIDWYGAITIPHPRCLDCHGLLSEGDIFPEVLAAINEKYPNDKAVNFELGDVRGMWKISFPREFWASSL